MELHTGRVAHAAELFCADERRDIATCGVSLRCDRATRCGDKGAHDPTATPYVVLDELFSHVFFGPDAHLLDVGCSCGRVLAYAASALPDLKVTGIELDPSLASYAAAWAARFDRLEVRCGNVLDEPLAPYTHLYLFNPFDTAVLVRLIDKLEREATAPVTVIHMSDNGEQYAYLGRAGWRILAQGSYQDYRQSGAPAVRIYGCPQTYTVWEYTPHGL
ncbi:class I SAM-dependent methyltransferase [Collinsella tanakaei]|uniref:class I SAM-dependent methyltransferase n=1 Tax=Collinsella tanakaei TaxID=626935 RepID=UPI00195BD615|nr:class I SAM-dependent methyltransferase [Collinsella tanakaei]